MFNVKAAGKWAVIRSFLKKYKIINCLFMVVFIAGFFLARYPFYQYFPVPLPVVADGGYYYEVYKALLMGNAEFGFITPGYPLFIYFVHLFSEKAIALYKAQSIVAFISSLIFLFYTFRYYSKIFPLVSIALLLFMMQDGTLRFETASFPESLMTSSLLLFLGFLIAALHSSGKNVYLFLLGLSATYLIILKSSGVYIIPVVIIIAIYFFYKQKRKSALLTILFFTIPLIIVASYNLFTIGAFTIIAAERLEKKTAPNFLTPEFKELLLKIGKRFPEWHPVYHIHHSSNLDTLSNAFLLTRWGMSLHKDTMTGHLHAHVRFEMKQTVDVDSIIQSNDSFSIEEKEEYFSRKDLLNGLNVQFYPMGIKRYCSSFLNFLLNIKRNAPLFYFSEVRYRYENIFITREWAQSPYELSGKKLLMREFYDPPERTISMFDHTFSEMSANVLFKLYDLYNVKIGRMISRNIVWAYLFAIIGVIASVMFFINPWNRNLFFPIVLVLIHLGAALVYTIWSWPLDRYSHATEFIPYLLVSFAPLLFFRKEMNDAS